MPSVISIEEQREKVRELLSAPEFWEIRAHPGTGVFGQRYYPIVDGGVDKTFAVLAKDRPVLLCLCAQSNGALSHYGNPIKIFVSKSADKNELSKSGNLALDHLEGLARAARARSIVVEEKASTEISFIGRAAMARKYRAEVAARAVVDVGSGIEAARKALRKSFRACINWGRRNLTIVIVDRQNPDRELFGQYQAFHAKIAGRATRPQIAPGMLCSIRSKPEVRSSSLAFWTVG